MNTLDALLAGIVTDPAEETRWLVLADWLDEHDDPRRGELLRLHRRLLATCREPGAHPERARWQARAVELLAAGVEPCVPRHTLALPGGVPLVGAFVPPGAFLMGGTYHEDEQPVHEVALTRGFFAGIHPVTQAQWAAVTGTDPSEFRGPNRPVERVSWDEAREFCARLTAILSGRAEVRLPTEAEWEWACRAGTTTEYHFGDVTGPDRSNYEAHSSWSAPAGGGVRVGTTEVGSFPPNPWGLYDMHGNVAEWCADEYRPYPGGARADPCADGDRPEGRERVPRGGSWYDGHPEYSRSAYRSGYAPTARFSYLGLRVVFRPA